MLSAVDLLLLGLGAIIALFTLTWWVSARSGHPHGAASGFQLALDGVTLFFDSLGIGNFAPTTAVFRMTRMVRDELIPGTLRVGILGTIPLDDTIGPSKQPVSPCGAVFLQTLVH